MTDPNPKEQPVSNERIYPCSDCGIMRSEAEGGKVFTVCDTCWKKIYPDKPVSDQPTCLGYPLCDGDLAGEPHEKEYPVSDQQDTAKPTVIINDTVTFYRDPNNPDCLSTDPFAAPAPPSNTQGAREWLRENWSKVAHLSNSFNDMAELLDSFASSRNAELEKERDTALANADFWERELNNFRRNAAHRAEQLAEEKVKLAESRVASLTGVVGELAWMLFRCGRELSYVQEAEVHSQCASAEGAGLVDQVMKRFDTDYSIETKEEFIARAKLIPGDAMVSGNGDPA